MQKQEFKKLLDKYVKGTLSVQEEEVLDRFNKEMESKTKVSSFKNEFEKIQIQKSIWSGVQKKLNAKPVIREWKLVASVAAIFIGLVATGYLYQETATVSTLDLIPENAITLELEDGSIKVIEENGTTSILNKNGIILGQQKGNQLIYNNKSNVEKLVYNTLKIPYGKTFELELSDGTKAYLNAGSSIKYPIKFLNGFKREVFITGEAYLNVAKDSLHPFIASSKGLNVQVLGTQFNFSAYPEDSFTEVVLVEGSVSLFTDQNGYNPEKNTFLTPGLKGSFERENNNVTTKEVNTSSYTSWMTGKLVFRNMMFKNILKKLERHYDVTIINNNKELGDKIFNANFGRQSIKEVFKELNMNYGIEYTISNKQVTINK